MPGAPGERRQSPVQPASNRAGGLAHGVQQSVLPRSRRRRLDGAGPAVRGTCRTEGNPGRVPKPSRGERRRASSPPLSHGWEPWEGSQTLPRRAGTSKARLRSRGGADWLCSPGAAGAARAELRGRRLPGSIRGGCRAAGGRDRGRAAGRLRRRPRCWPGIRALAPPARRALRRQRRPRLRGGDRRQRNPRARRRINARSGIPPGPRPPHLPVRQQRRVGRDGTPPSDPRRSAAITCWLVTGARTAVAAYARRSAADCHRPSERNRDRARARRPAGARG